ncbi:DUF616 domain-containing protein [Alkalihalophilus pseudofirmus]|uniref:glycosyltransferase domain-containing protein n=1 Tax=Alkalihalophilus pseudofirmus TaxID=79885 RepID=UPI00259B635B|nr:glycosyltransferase domain-containing protein [Alkalihalophilus pseudofirmus]WEG15359.1 DUF616 domain-containing protein [Alkalihalophilus pseudofirmus]
MREANEVKKIAIYTVIIGKYDALLNPAFIDENIDYICFTDDKYLTSSIWKVVLVETLKLDNARESRRYKILPHLYLREYEISMYVDANIKILTDPRPFCLNSIKKAPITLFSHPVRKCIFKEAEVCIKLKKDEPRIIHKQMEFYKSKNYPLNNGLVECGVLIRRHNEQGVINIMNDWWLHVKNYSKRDQLSFNFVTKEVKDGYINLLNMNLRNHECFNVVKRST